jgi:hypothetical protein
MNGQKDLVNSPAGRHVIADEENARHALASRDSGIGEGWNRSAIVRQENSVLDRGPLENRRVG